MKSIAVLFMLIVTGCEAGPLSSSFEDASIPPYDRSQWGRWIDADKDCQDTRQEVLISESLRPVTYEDEKQCRVLSGLWKDPYTGTMVESPYSLDIDHVIALEEAHYAGGWKWSLEQKKAYNNDLTNHESLVAVSSGVNRSKGSRLPNEWMPPAPELRCQYLKSRVKILRVWGLIYDPDQYIDWMIEHCK